MIPITAKDLHGMVHQDYKHNFMPRKEIGLVLSFDQMKEFLKNQTLQEQIMTTWHFNFYVKQLFLLSWKKIEQSDSSVDIKLNMIDGLSKIVEFAHFNETRVLVTIINVSFFLKRISTLELRDIFFGHSNYDDYCAQIAYEEYKLRYANEIVS